jgi:uncharacterized protein
MKNKNEPWYKDGLQFKCTECGKCCRGVTGYVWLSPNEILAISSYLGIGIEEFMWKYIRIVGNRYSLIEKKLDDEHLCIFLKDNQCSIYPFRPKQCRTFPWWPTLLKNEDSWKSAKEDCEGILHQDGEIVPFEAIEKEKNSYTLYLKEIDEDD